jgi:hypothetical protein
MRKDIFRECVRMRLTAGLPFHRHAARGSPMSHPKSAIFVLTCLAAIAQAASIPKITGPIKVTAASRPFGSTWSIDLAAFGYVEEEYFVSGNANIYQWNPAGTAVEVRTPNAPYTTRILVIRPAAGTRFNGKAMVDIVNMSNGWDFNKLWAVMHDHLIENGWAYVGISSKPVVLKALKNFDAARYAPLSWANPLSATDPANCGVTAADSSRETENGLAWDIFSQIGALLKSDARDNPVKAKQVYLTGFSQSGGFIYTYVNGFAATARLAGGRPIYDGFLMGGSTPPQPINQCAPAIPAGDPRTKVMPGHPQPVILLNAAKDVLGNINSYARRQDDSDAPGMQFRLYELPGSSHSWLYQSDFNVACPDVIKAGFANCADSVPEGVATIPGSLPGDMPIHYIWNGALDNLDRWAAKGVPPPRAERLAVEAATPGAKPTFKLDANGNHVGGVRTPYVDVPLATYTVDGSIWSWVTKIPFTTAKMQALYGTKEHYVQLVIEAARTLVRDHWITSSDAAKIVAEAAKSNVPTAPAK